MHQVTTNEIRNLAKVFAHLLSTDAIPWQVLSVIFITEDMTTASSRIFIKELFLEVHITIGLKKLIERLNDP